MGDAPPAPGIYVIAGTNGAGKSSIAGAMLRQRGVEHFDPDEATRRILAANPGATLERANSDAWHEGVRLLERAIAERLSFAFETTLSGETITGALERALRSGIPVRVWYVGLDDPELHIARVRARVARGGHDVPPARIRERYDRSRANLVRLLPALTELRVYDNSEDADPAEGVAPRPWLLLHLAAGKMITSCPLAATPRWAKPILAAALRSDPSHAPRRERRRR